MAIEIDRGLFKALNELLGFENEYNIGRCLKTDYDRLVEEKQAVNMAAQARHTN